MPNRCVAAKGHFCWFWMISVPEGQIKEILRPESSCELLLMARLSQKWSNWLPLKTSQIHYLSDLLSRGHELKHHNLKPSQICKDLMNLLNYFLNLRQIIHSFWKFIEKIRVRGTFPFLCSGRHFCFYICFERLETT